MPDKWPDNLYDYEAGAIVHEDVEALDIAEGRWFKCKVCKIPKDWKSHNLGIIGCAANMGLVGGMWVGVGQGLNSITFWR